MVVMAKARRECEWWSGGHADMSQPRSCSSGKSTNLTVCVACGFKRVHSIGRRDFHNRSLGLALGSGKRPLECGVHFGSCEPPISVCTNALHASRVNPLNFKFSLPFIELFNKGSLYKAQCRKKQILIPILNIQLYLINLGTIYSQIKYLL